MKLMLGQEDGRHPDIHEYCVRCSTCEDLGDGWKEFPFDGVITSQVLSRLFDGRNFRRVTC